jgi:hypothetical protein
MSDIKSSFGLGVQTGTAITNLKNDLLSLATLIENTLLPKIEKMASSLNAASKNLNNVVQGSKSSNLLIADKHGRITGTAGDTKDTTAGNRVAPAPVFTEPKAAAPAAGATQPSGNGGGNDNNRVAAGGDFASVAAGVAFGAKAISAALPGVPESVLQDYMTVRSGFYGIGGTGSQQNQSANIHTLQKQLANKGTMTDSMDSTKAIYAGQKLGLTGYTNYSTGKNSVVAGAASISNLEPGLGGEGAMQAQAAAAKPTAVNMLRMIGINMVDSKGRLTTTAQMIDQIWDYLMRTDGPKALTVQAIQFEATPGHGLYNMLSGIFNGNQDMINIVVDGLIMKAKLKGASVANLTREQMQKAGGVSATVNKIAAKTAAQNDLLVDTAANTSAGYGASADLAKAMNRFADLAPGLIGALGSINGFLTGFAAIGGGLLGTITSLLVAKGVLKAGTNIFKGSGVAATAAETVAKDARYIDPITGAAYASRSAAEAAGAIGTKTAIAAVGGGALATGAAVVGGVASAGGAGNLIGEGAKDIGNVTGLNKTSLGKKVVKGGGIAGGAASGALVGAISGAAIPVLGELGIGEAAGAIVGGIIGGIGGWLGTREKGGPVDNKTPYIVGEKGPELFVPKSDGTIIPNHVIGKQDGGKVSAGGFAKELLKGLGMPVTPQNIKDVTMWEGMEGGNWHNSAHFNPLNTSYQSKGSTNFNTGKAGGGVQAYGSWKQGLDATIGTLTGANADKRGYTNIIDTLKSGKASQAEFLTALQGSAWDAGRYKGGSSSSGLGYRPGANSSGVSTTDSTLVAQQQAAAQAAWAAIGGGLSGSSSGDFHNHGGVTINIDAGTYSHDALKKMMADVLSSKGIQAQISG